MQPYHTVIKYKRRRKQSIKNSFKTQNTEKEHFQKQSFPHPPRRQEDMEEVKKILDESPDDVTERILAITRRCYYPNLSLASKNFNRILGTPGIYHLRSALGVTEPILYASIGFPPSESASWFILHQEKVSLRLRKILSLPSRLLIAVATVGTDMYVLGGSVSGKPTSDVNLIDCRFHTSRSLPSMKRARSGAVAGAIDGKIYVIGGCTKESDFIGGCIESFDVETQSWRDMPWVLPRVHCQGKFVTSAVMDDKIFVLGTKCLVFDPNVGALVQWDDGGELKKLWQASSCVIDDRLYTIDLGRSLKHPIIVYDPKAEEKRWRPVYGVNLSRDLRPLIAYYDSKMANFGGKLLILVGGIAMPDSHCEDEQVWCVKIALERHGDEIWGHVESTELVLESKKWPSIELSRTVTL